MDGKLQEYLWLPYSVEVLPDQTTDGEPCYRAQHPELPGCMSHGSTPEEAIEGLGEARKLYIETLLQMAQPVPKPARTQAATVVSDSEKVIWRIVDLSVTEDVEEETNTKWPIPSSSSIVT